MIGWFAERHFGDINWGDRNVVHQERNQKGRLMSGGRPSL